jgi:hypothetical protein
MGCDIHTFVERRVAGKWICVTKQVKDADGDTYWDDPYEERRYTTFAVLAGVRNGDGYEPIDQPRGLPRDLSDEGRARTADDDGYHGHSWLSLQDLLDFDWTKVHATEGSIKMADFGGRVADGSIDKTLCYLRPDSGAVFYPKIESYAEACEYFLNSMIPYMAALGAPEDVRLVFYFDS